MKQQGLLHIHVRKEAHDASGNLAGKQPEVKGGGGNSCLKRTYLREEELGCTTDWKVLKGWGF